MPIYKIDGKNADGLQKYKIKIKQKDTLGQWHSLTRIAYGLNNAKLLEQKLLAETSSPAPIKMSLSQLFAEYLETNANTLRASTLATNTKIFDNYIRDPLGDLNISTLNIQQLQKWKNGINALPLSLTTKQNIYTVLNLVLNYRVKYEYIQVNPLKKLGTFKDSNQIKTEMSVYTPDQWIKYRDTALQYATENNKFDYYVFFCIAYYTGLRKGEIHALRWTALDNDFFSVRTSIAQTAQGDIETPPKNNSSIRTIQIPLPLKDVLETHRKCQIEHITNFAPAHFICGYYRPLRNTSLDNFNRKISDLAGLPRLRIHDFRHTHASTLINANVPVIEISKRLGHSSIEQTLETYSHLFKQTSQQSISVLNDIK